MFLKGTKSIQFVFYDKILIYRTKLLIRLWLILSIYIYLSFVTVITYAYTANLNLSKAYRKNTHRIISHSDNRIMFYVTQKTLQFTWPLRILYEVHALFPQLDITSPCLRTIHTKKERIKKHSQNLKYLFREHI